MMSTPVTGEPQTCFNRSADETELSLLELQLSVIQSTHHLLGKGRFGLPKLCNGLKGHSHFTTFPRKSRVQRPLMTIWQDRGLLDEGQVRQTRRILSDISTHWDFNAFSLDRLTGGHNLAFLCIHLLQENDLLRFYGLDPLVAWKFFSLVEDCYHATNPYHNAVHAADVTQAMSRFLSEAKLRQHLKPSEIFACILAAVCHDLDHPGLNEKFLIGTSAHLAGLYNNTSVLENHHWSMAVALMHESGLSSALTSAQHQEIVDIIRSLILATDISRQQEFLTQLRYLLDRDELNLSQTACRHFMLQIALKCADISNPCRSWSISRLWSHRACEEFFRQGDRERSLGLPVTPFCDRNNITVAKVQSTFYRYVASPLFEEWHRFLDSSLSIVMMNNLTSNQGRWDMLVQQEGSASMAESVASTSSSSGPASQQNDPPSSGRDPSNRCSSVDDEDSDPCMSYPYLPLDESEDGLMSRRHSLPFVEAFAQSSDLRRQSSFSERRSRLPEDSSTFIAAQRRRIFANRVVAHSDIRDMSSQNTSMDVLDPPVEAESAICSNSFESQKFDAGQKILKTHLSDDAAVTPSEATRVTFEIGSEMDEDLDEKENISSNIQRRGSAPPYLLHCQISRVKRISSPLSRENSHLTMRGLNEVNRRGSLPSELVCCESAVKKRHANNNVRLGSSFDISFESALSRRAHPRRGSFRSSSFGGVGHNRKGTASGIAHSKKQIKKIPKNGLFLNSDEVFLDIKSLSLQAHFLAKFSSATNPELLPGLQGINGRRGSLPVEFLTLPHVAERA